MNHLCEAAPSTFLAANLDRWSIRDRRILDTVKNHPYLTPDQLAHSVAPEAVADIIAYLVSDAAAPVSGAIVPAYGA